MDERAPKVLVVGIFTLAVAAVLLAVAVSVAPSKPASPLRPEMWSLPPLPPEVKSEINEAIKGCDGEVKFEEGFVTRRDINGEGSAVILDYGDVVCGEYGDGGFCGSAGCLTKVFVPNPDGTFTKVVDENVHAIKFGEASGRPAIFLELHGNECGRAGAEPCSATLYWNGEKFSPAN